MGKHEHHTTKPVSAARGIWNEERGWAPCRLSDSTWFDVRFDVSVNFCLTLIALLTCADEFDFIGFVSHAGSGKCAQLCVRLWIIEGLGL